MKCKEWHWRDNNQEADMSFRLKDENQGKQGANFLIKRKILIKNYIHTGKNGSFGET